MDSSENPSEVPQYVPAQEYLETAGLRVTGRTLQRWCDANPFLADAIGEFRSPGKRLYNLRTAPRFRQLWTEAQRRVRAER